MNCSSFFRTIRTILFAGLVTVFVPILSSCGGGDDGGQLDGGQLMVRPPTPEGAPDLVILNPSVGSDDIKRPGESFTLRVDVVNQGRESAEETVLRYYVSSNSSIDSGDELLGTDSVRSLDPGETDGESIRVSAPSRVGNYFFGACVVSVPGETVEYNNCDGTWVDVTRDGENSHGAIALRNAGGCTFDTYIALEYTSESRAVDTALDGCKRFGSGCRIVLRFANTCGAVAVSPYCDLGYGRADTRSGAERDAIDSCFGRSGEDCDVLYNRVGNRVSDCSQ